MFDNFKAIRLVIALTMEPYFKTWDSFALDIKLLLTNQETHWNVSKHLHLIQACSLSPVQFKALYFKRRATLTWRGTIEGQKLSQQVTVQCRNLQLHKGTRSVKRRLQTNIKTAVSALSLQRPLLSWQTQATFLGWVDTGCSFNT